MLGGDNEDDRPEGELEREGVEGDGDVSDEGVPCGWFVNVRARGAPPRRTGLGGEAVRLSSGSNLKVPLSSRSWSAVGAEVFASDPAEVDDEEGPSPRPGPTAAELDVTVATRCIGA